MTRNRTAPPTETKDHPMIKIDKELIFRKLKNTLASPTKVFFISILFLFAANILNILAYAFAVLSFYSYILLCTKIRKVTLFFVVTALLFLVQKTDLATPFLLAAAIIMVVRMVRVMLLQAIQEMRTSATRMSDLYKKTKSEYIRQIIYTIDNQKMTSFVVRSCIVIFIYPIISFFLFDIMMEWPARAGTAIPEYFFGSNPISDAFKSFLMQALGVFKIISFYGVLLVLFMMLAVSVFVSWILVRVRAKNQMSWTYMLVELALLSSVLIHYSNVLGTCEGCNWTNLPWPGDSFEQWALNWSSSYLGSIVRSLAAGFTGITILPFAAQLPWLKSIPFLPKVTPTSPVAEGIALFEALGVFFIALEVYLRSRKKKGADEKDTQ